MHAKGEPIEQAKRKALGILEQFGLGDLSGRRPNQLSGGQRQRVAIARALAMEPELILLDEVTSNLDPELVADVLSMLRRLSRAGLTMVLVTHHIEFAREIADEVVVLDEGAIVEQGHADEVLASPKHPRTKRFLEALCAAR